MPTGEADVGARVDTLLGEIAEQGGAQAAATADELVRTVVEFYGGALERIVELVGPDAVRELTRDPQVESMLVLHDLHPLGVDERIEAALDRVRPYLGSHAGGVAYLGVDEQGVAHLRLDGSCNGCPSSTVTVRMTIEEALLAAAPDLQGLDVEGAADEAEQKPLLQIGRRPASAPTEPRWLHPSALDLPADGGLSGAMLDGRGVLLLRLRETYYAYADACPTCGGTLATGSLSGDVLTCASCAARYDVRLAGMSADGSGRRLDPLPLLDDVSGVRVAVQAQPQSVVA